MEETPENYVPGLEMPHEACNILRKEAIVVTRVSVSSAISVYAGRRIPMTLPEDRIIDLYPGLAQIVLNTVDVSSLQLLPIYPAKVPKMDGI